MGIMIKTFLTKEMLKDPMAKDPLYTDESLRMVRLFSLEEERN
jgi:hypothetical protein